MTLSEQQISLCKFGAYSAIIASISYAIVTLLALSLPPSIATYLASPQYFIDFKEIKHIFLTLKTVHSIANLGMIGVVVTFLSLCRKKHYGLIVWCTLIAIIGYAVGIFQNIQDASLIPHLAKQYEIGTPLMQQTILTLGIANPFLFIISLGFPGIWFIVVSLIGHSNKHIPTTLIYLGLLWGIGNIVTAVAHALMFINLIYLIALGALIFAPIWGFMEAFYLFKLIKINQ